jgi:RHS repeat-associated protein
VLLSSMRGRTKRLIFQLLIIALALLCPLVAHAQDAIQSHWKSWGGMLWVYHDVPFEIQNPNYPPGFYRYVGIFRFGKGFDGWRVEANASIPLWGFPEFDRALATPAEEPNPSRLKPPLRDGSEFARYAPGGGLETLIFEAIANGLIPGGTGEPIPGDNQDEAPPTGVMDGLSIERCLGGCPDPLLADGGADSVADDGDVSQMGSRINIHQMTHIHDAEDYRIDLPEGCASCGGGAGASTGRLPTLMLQRLHRYHDIDFPSSFGPGVFLNYNISLTCRTVQDISSVVLFDPRGQSPITLVDLNSNGVYTDDYHSLIAHLRFYDDQGSPAGGYSTAATAVATGHNGFSYAFEMIRDNNGRRFGRLTRIADRNGQGITISYRYVRDASNDELSDDRSRLWQIRTIIDAYGNTAKPHYRSAPFERTVLTDTIRDQVVESIDLPNETRLLYRYDNAQSRVSRLSRVEHPDGTVSTFTITGIPKPEFIVVEDLDELGKFTVAYDDASSHGTHRRKTVTYSLPMTLLYVKAEDSKPTYRWRPDSGVRIQRIVNPLSQEVFACKFRDLGNGTKTVTYREGGGSVKRYSAKTGSGDPIAIETLALGTGKWQKTRSFGLLPNNFQRITSRTDGLGRQTSYELDSVTGAVLRRTFADNSFETFRYNGYRQILSHSDRRGRTHVYTYDAKGNILTETVAGGTADAATTRWRYAEEGSNARAGQPSSTVDANGNVTRYVYNDAGLLVQLIEPPDATGGEQATHWFAYDSSGRMTSSTSPTGAVTTYGYDERNRVVDIAYADGSHERTGYGRSARTANLVVWKSNRNGYISVNRYDDAGRVIEQVSGLRLLPDSEPSDNLSHYANLDQASSTTTTYFEGTSLPLRVKHDGEVTTYRYDNEKRCVQRTVYTWGTLGRRQDTVYDAAGRVRSQSESFIGGTYSDAFATIRLYDSIDRITRIVREARSGSISAFSDAQLLIKARDTSTAPGWVIDDFQYDVTGYQATALSSDRISEVRIHRDGRNIAELDALDWRGRSREHVVAYGTVDAAVTVKDYDPQGNLVRHYPPRYFSEGAATGYSVQTWTGRNLLQQSTQGFGTAIASTTAYTWLLDRKTESVTVAAGSADAATTIFRYSDCCQRLREREDALGRITNFNYDNLGNLLSVTDPNGNETAVTYDNRSRPITWVNGEGETTIARYDDHLGDGKDLDATYPNFAAALSGLTITTWYGDGSAVAITDPTGANSLRITDGFGRVRRVVDANGHATTYDYDGITSLATAGIITTTTSAIGQKHTDAKNGLGWLISSQDAGFVATTCSYDGNGNRIAVKDSNGFQRNFAFDNRNRLVKATDPRGDQVQNGYDTAGNLVWAADGFNVKSSYSYDPRNRRVKEKNRVNAETILDYDLRNNLLAITDAEGGVTSYVFNAANELRSETFPGATGGTVIYQYDNAGRLWKRTDQRGIIVTFEYDDANRILARHYPDNLDEHFTYDDAGRLLTAISDRYRSAVSRIYDPAGLLMKEVQTIAQNSYTVGYGYDAADRQTAVRYPDETPVGRIFTARNQLQEVRFGGAIVATRLYDAGMRLTKTTYGNGRIESRDYRTDNLVQTISTPGVSALSYTYDQNKAKLTESDSLAATANQTFAYDAESRLKSWSRASGETQQWALSAVGDWDLTTVDGITETRSHSDVHEVTGRVTGTSSTTLTYDANGNLATDGSGHQYGWDAENRLSEAVVPGIYPDLTDTAHYAYDALGRRIQKTFAGTSTNFVHDGAQVIQEIDGHATTANIASAELAAAADGSAASASRKPTSGGVIDNPLVRINHQPADELIPAGFVRDGGALFAKRTNGLSYGWEKVPGTPIVRHSFPIPQFATCIPLGSASWMIDLPNGTYPVVIVCGDADSRQQTNTISVNGAVQTDPDPYDRSEDPGYLRGDFDGYAVSVTVTDGKLTVNAAAGAVNPKICFIEIGHIGSVVDQTTLDRLALKIQSATDRTGGPVATVTQPNPRIYVYGPYVDEPLMMQTGTGIVAKRYYFHSNHLYSVAALTDSSGAVVERYKYDGHGRRTVLSPTGVVLGNESAYGNNVGFTGRYLDQETGLWFFRARYFDSGLGRFIKRDPLGYVDGLGLYSGYFVPNGIDPNGTYVLLVGTDAEIKLMRETLAALCKEEPCDGMLKQLTKSKHPHRIALRSLKNDGEDMFRFGRNRPRAGSGVDVDNEFDAWAKGIGTGTETTIQVDQVDPVNGTTIETLIAHEMTHAYDADLGMGGADELRAVQAENALRDAAHKRTSYDGKELPNATDPFVLNPMNLVGSTASDKLMNAVRRFNKPDAARQGVVTRSEAFECE